MNKQLFNMHYYFYIIQILIQSESLIQNTDAKIDTNLYIACEEQLYVNLNNADYNFYIFRLFEKHESYNQIRSNHFTSVYILSEHRSSEVSDNTIVKDQLPQSCTKTIDFKYATCQTS